MYLEVVVVVEIYDLDLIAIDRDWVLDNGKVLADSMIENHEEGSHSGEILKEMWLYSL